MIPGMVNSEWISASNGEEWVYLDFGAITSLRSVKAHWGANYAIAYDIQVSNDAKTWKNGCVCRRCGQFGGGNEACDPQGPVSADPL